MEKDVRRLVGICGLYCGTCPSYLAHRKNDTELLKKMARERGHSIEALRCDGCLSDKVAPHCVDCRHGFRKCAHEKEVTWCFECTDFPCQRLRDFTDVHVVDGISHHKHIIEENAYLREHGIEPWIKKQEAAAKCPGCGGPLYWHVRECESCHAKVR